MNSSSSPSPTRSVWPAGLIGFMVGAALTYVLMQQNRMAADSARARAEHLRLLAQQTEVGALHKVLETRLSQVEKTVADLENRRPRADVMFSPMEGRGDDAPVGPSRSIRTRRGVIVNRPPGEGPEAPVVMPFPGPPGRRGWSHEQATGAPDTPQAGDYTTAWAAREPDGGSEWLRLGFENAVEIAEVRIRETYNPGAVSRVAAVVNGREQTLWEGEAERAPAPREFVPPVQERVTAQTIVIYLDTLRVPGWNEIDAVELVGKDGSRQWAKTSAASSSYGDNRPPTPAEPVEAIEPIPTPGRQ